ncbi:Calcium/calmodulin-dependent protein kinase type I [Glugoides intestinalis]
MDLFLKDYVSDFKSTYKRSYKKLKIAFTVILTILVTFFLLKIFKAGELKFDMKVTDYINKEMDRILQYKTREKQNEEFKRLVSKHPIEPIRMTLTTAVFKYTGITPNVILKRIIYNPENNLNEDYMSMRLNSAYTCKTLKTFRTKRLLSNGIEQQLLWIIFEYLDVRISQKSVAGDEKIIRKIMADALKGLEFMHFHNVAHLDLKIGNIMGKTKERGVFYKLIDFGYSQVMPNTGSIVIPNKNYGTYPYKPPEIVFKHEHGIKSDIWSLGAICWFLSLQYTPFYFEGFKKDRVSYEKFLKDKSTNKENHKFIFTKHTSTALKDFVKKCMHVDPESRPTAHELLMHPFITGKSISIEMDTTDEIDDSSYITNSTETS